MGSTKKLSEEEIIKRLQAGIPRDRSSAIRALYTDEWIKLARKAVKSVGGKESDVEDIFQECLAALVKNVMNRQFKRESKLSTYFYQICRWRTIKVVNKQQFLELKTKMVEDISPSLETLLMDKEKRIEKKLVVGQLLKNLGHPCDSILKYISLGYSMEEIAQEMQYSNKDTVKNQAARCRKRMRKLIESQPDVYKKLKELR